MLQNVVQVGTHRPTDCAIFNMPPFGGIKTLEVPIFHQYLKDNLFVYFLCQQQQKKFVKLIHNLYIMVQKLIYHQYIMVYQSDTLPVYHGLLK
jgi:hypothetical protein